MSFHESLNRLRHLSTDQLADAVEMPSERLVH